MLHTILYRTLLYFVILALRTVQDPKKHESRTECNRFVSFGSYNVFLAIKCVRDSLYAQSCGPGFG